MRSTPRAIAPSSLVLLATAALTTPALAGGGGGTIHRATSADRDGLTAAVDAFRDELGTFNAPEPGTVGEGRRQIDWDAAPDAVSAPNPFDGGFFNRRFFPVARGVVFTTPGTGFQLSATAASGAGVDFSNIDPGYADVFESFSPERLFTPIGANVVDVTFKVPGVDRDALSHGFGAIFSDVDLDDSTSMEFFDKHGTSLGHVFVDAGASWPADEHFSLLGLTFDEPIVARVRIVTGNTALAPGALELDASIDLVVMDDLIFGEPVPADRVIGDADLNGIVEFADLIIVLSTFGPCEGCPQDFDLDGVVSWLDLIALLANYDV